MMMSAERCNHKPPNPKDALGIAKAPMSCVPVNVVAELGVAMMEGALKYGRYNWRTADVRGSVYFDAAIRHLFAWWEGENIDPDSGMSHVVKAMASLCVLRDGMQQPGFTDDRPGVNTKLKYAELNKHVVKLLMKYRPDEDMAQPGLKASNELTCRWVVGCDEASVVCCGHKLSEQGKKCGYCDAHCGHARGVCAKKEVNDSNSPT